METVGAMTNFPYILCSIPPPSRQCFGTQMLSSDDMIQVRRTPRTDYAFNMFYHNYNLLIDEDEESVGEKERIVLNLNGGTRKRRCESIEAVQPFMSIKHQKVENMQHIGTNKSKKLNSFGLSIALLTQAAKDVSTKSHLQSTKNVTPADVIKSQDPKSKELSKSLMESRPREENSVIGKKWYQRFQELLEFKKKHGHCNVPHTCKELKQLAVWVSNQRQFCKKVREGKPSQITRQRIELLDQVGFDWCLDRNPEEKWRQRYEELKKYKKQYGHCNVPQRKSEHKQLSIWVNRQRYFYKKLQQGDLSTSGFSQKHIEALEKIGFEWSPDRKSGEKWQQRYNELVEYKKIHGHCNVPQRQEDVRQLAIWVTHQRNFYKKLKEGSPSQITEERIKALEKIGFDWSPDRKLNSKWQERYEELIEYKKKYGHCDVPRKYDENKKLATWVNSQRYFYRNVQSGKQSYITEERIELLQKIGFRWTKKSES